MIRRPSWLRYASPWKICATITRASFSGSNCTTSGSHRYNPDVNLSCLRTAPMLTPQSTTLGSHLNCSALIEVPSLNLGVRSAMGVTAEEYARMGLTPSQKINV